MRCNLLRFFLDYRSGEVELLFGPDLGRLRGILPVAILDRNGRRRRVEGTEVLGQLFYADHDGLVRFGHGGRGLGVGLRGLRHGRSEILFGGRELGCLLLLLLLLGGFLERLHGGGESEHDLVRLQLGRMADGKDLGEVLFGLGGWERFGDRDGAMEGEEGGDMYIW